MGSATLETLIPSEQLSVLLARLHSHRADFETLTETEELLHSSCRFLLNGCRSGFSRQVSRDMLEMLRDSLPEFQQKLGKNHELILIGQQCLQLVETYYS